MKVIYTIFAATLYLACPSNSWGQALPFTHHSEMGVLSGRDEFGSRTNFTFQTFNGFQLSDQHAFGFVTGLDQYGSLSVVPVAMGWRAVLNPEDTWQLYGGVDLGFGSTLLEPTVVTEWNEHRWQEGGFMGQGSIGLRLKTKRANFWTLSLAYKRQIYHLTTGNPREPSPDPNRPEDWSYYAKDKITFNNVVYRLGYWF
ncbi:hypothetical protein [Cyclobacterium roseum]|uniref:hypothetical protein n=1 Tax=Cyclobacterium roseum TaxID=2666137 RepID=UPI0013913DAE|nr:hypothetical protein [Cyclobacterium roseum]